MSSLQNGKMMKESLSKNEKNACNFDNNNTVNEKNDDVIQSIDENEQTNVPINSSLKWTDNFVQPRTGKCLCYQQYRADIFSELIQVTSKNKQHSNNSNKNSTLKDDGYEAYLQNIHPDDLCDCQNCLTIWKKNPKAVLELYGVKVNDNENDQEMLDDESYYNENFNNFVQIYKSDNDNASDDYCDNGENCNQKTASNFNSSSSVNGQGDNDDPTRKLKSNLVESVVLGLSQHQQAKLKKPVVTHTFQPVSNYITQRKFEKSVISQMIATVSLACKLETCPLLFLDKGQLELHMFSAHGIYPYKCLADCVDKYFPSKKALIDHTKAEHSDHKIWKCNFCKNRVYSKYHCLYAHITKEHEAGVFKCTWPEHQMTFRFRQEVVNHILQTHNIKFGKTFWKKESFLGSSSNGNEEEENDTDDDDTDDDDTDDDENNEDEQEIQPLQAQHQDIENGNNEIPNANNTNHFPIMSNMANTYRPRRSSLLSPEKHVYQYLCTWPDCGKTSSVIWNLRRHIRTVHFKLPKTKQEMQNENINVSEINLKESKYIHILTL